MFSLVRSPRTWLVVVAVIALGATCFVSYRYGVAVTTSRFVKADNERLLEVHAQVDKALRDLARDIVLENERAAAAAAARRESNEKGLEVISDTLKDLDLSCEWRDAHRLRIQRQYDAFGFATGSDSK